ncbi:PLC-like phosphodiesterase [Saitoella complicata NRRL Y-17804]|nr:PLC-like phosphodiesterase [Saitoella complicata NRRL Y-17804]ODQ52652.1 PLC-like phosphodiesterase [Saitoella complicata NRRL Y-17804]
MSTAPSARFSFARSGVPQNIGHRGYKALYPENTLLAMREAIRAGASAIETDIHLSKDGTVVICHDPSVDRVFDGEGLVAAKTDEELRRLRTKKAPHEGMPTLRDVLKMVTSEKEYEDVWLLLDTKMDNPKSVIEKIGDTLKSVNPSMTYWSSRILLGIWHPKFLPACATHLPELPITNISLTLSITNKYFPLHHPQISAYNILLPALSGLAGQKFVRDAQDAGKSVCVWTVNDEKWMRWARKLGVDGVITDDVAQFKQIEGEDEKESDGVLMGPEEWKWKAWGKVKFWEYFAWGFGYYRLWQFRDRGV